MHRRQHRSALILSLLLLAGFLLAACGQQASTPEEKWAMSAHADKEAPAFVRWNGSPPADVPANCAKCHSTIGYHDFLGLDGSAPGTVEKTTPGGTTVECEACHNDVAKEKASAVMPSGAELTGLGKEAPCADCHQGRAATTTVDEATVGLGADTVNTELSFINIHNNPAAPLMHGSVTRSGYEYASQSYSGRYHHVVDFDTCGSCHDVHTLQVNVQNCQACHIKATSQETLADIRVRKTDFDGDGDSREGIAGEIETMRAVLLRTLKLYTALTEGVDDIVYESRNPYFFNAAGEDYSTWTPRLLRAAYNYQYATKSTGAYAHNADYVLQLLYDSIQDLGGDTAAYIRPGVR